MTTDVKLKSNLDLIKDCNPTSANPELHYTFHISDLPDIYGRLLQDTVHAMTWLKDYWKVDHDARVWLLGSTETQRTSQMKETLLKEKDKGKFQLLELWTGESCTVYGPNREPLISIERVAAPLFGILTYGVQLLAFTKIDDDLRVWVAQRAKHKRIFPGMLDSTVGGSLCTGETPFECLVREAEEEALFDPEFTRKNAIAVGTISYRNLTDERSKGEKDLLRPEIQFTYEMEIPLDMNPVPGDGEAEMFLLMSIEELKHELALGHFAPANGAVVLDFFVRHGIRTFENEPEYAAIVARLHRSHE